MPLTFNCPRCSAQLTVPESRAGVSGPCPKCGQVIQAPMAAAPPTPKPAGAGVSPAGGPDGTVRCEKCGGWTPVGMVCRGCGAPMSRPQPAPRQMGHQPIGAAPRSRVAYDAGSRFPVGLVARVAVALLVVGLLVFLPGPRKALKRLVSRVKVATAQRRSDAAEYAADQQRLQEQRSRAEQEDRWRAQQRLTLTPGQQRMEHQALAEAARAVWLQFTQDMVPEGETPESWRNKVGSAFDKGHSLADAQFRWKSDNEVSVCLPPYEPPHTSYSGPRDSFSKYVVIEMYRPANRWVADGRPREDSDSPPIWLKRNEPGLR